MPLMLFMLAALIVGVGLVRPLPQFVAVASRVLLLAICGTLAHEMFSQTRADNTIMLAIIVLLIGGWIATLSFGRTAKPGAPYGSTWIVPTAPQKEAVLIGGAAAAVLGAIVLLQKSSMMLGIPSQRADLASLVTFATCLACWSVIVGIAITPWRMNRSWTLPTTLVVVALFAVVVPAGWYMSDQDGSNAPIERTTGPAYQTQRMPNPNYGYQGPMAPSYDMTPMSEAPNPNNPFESATSAAAPVRMTFAASASIVATNLLAILGYLATLVRMLSARYARFEDDDAPLPGEHDEEGAVRADGPPRTDTPAGV